MGHKYFGLYKNVQDFKNSKNVCNFSKDYSYHDEFYGVTFVLESKFNLIKYRYYFNNYVLNYRIWKILRFYEIKQG